MSFGRSNTGRQTAYARRASARHAPLQHDMASVKYVSELFGTAPILVHFFEQIGGTRKSAKRWLRRVDPQSTGFVAPGVLVDVSVHAAASMQQCHTPAESGRVRTR